MGDADNAVKQPTNRRGRGFGTPFKPGQSGNPNGRPRKEKSVAEILRRIGKEPSEKDDAVEGASRLEYVLRKTYADAEDGNAHSRDFIVDRTEGKPTEDKTIRMDNTIDSMLQNASDEDLDAAIIAMEDASSDVDDSTAG